MNQDELINWKILHFLYKKRLEGGPYALGRLNDLAFELRIETKLFVSKYALELQENNLLEIVSHANEARITNKGMALIDSNNPFTNDDKMSETKNITIHGSVSGSQIVQGDNANISVSLNFLDKIYSEIDNSSELNKEEKKIWLKRIKEFGSHPVLVFLLKKVLG